MTVRNLVVVRAHHDAVFFCALQRPDDVGSSRPPSRAALSIVPERTPPSRTTRAELVRAPCFCPSLGSAALHKIGAATLSYSIFCAVMGNAAARSVKLETMQTPHFR